MESSNDILYQDAENQIRRMRESDIPVIAEAFRLQGWDKPARQYIEYYRQCKSGERKVFIAECNHQFAGYVTLLPQAASGPFAKKGIPEICDFNVLIKFRRRGIGSLLMDAAEREAAAVADTVCLGVGLYTDYGAAQRMYVKRGYIPDGSGVWYRDTILQPYESCRNDDDLILYLSKKLR